MRRLTRGVDEFDVFVAGESLIVVWFVGVEIKSQIGVPFQRNVSCVACIEPSKAAFQLRTAYGAG